MSARRNAAAKAPRPQATRFDQLLSLSAARMNRNVATISSNVLIPKLTVTKSPFPGGSSPAFALQGATPAGSGGLAQLVGERREGKGEGPDGVVGRDDVVAVLQHLQQVAGQRDVPGQPFGDQGIQLYEADGDVDARAPEAE